MKNEEWRIKSEKLKVESWKLFGRAVVWGMGCGIKSEEWRVKSEEWRIKSEEWRMKNEELRVKS